MSAHDDDQKQGSEDRRRDDDLPRTKLQYERPRMIMRRSLKRAVLTSSGTTGATATPPTE